MVGEFPELQGVMGGYYTRAQGLPDAVADAMLEGIAAGTYEIVPGLDAKFSVIGARVAPGLARWVCDSAQKKAQ